MHITLGRYRHCSNNVLRPIEIYVSEALAGAYKLHNSYVNLFFLSVHLGVLTPPPPPPPHPHTKKSD